MESNSQTAPTSALIAIKNRDLLLLCDGQTLRPAKHGRLDPTMVWQVRTGLAGDPNLVSLHPLAGQTDLALTVAPVPGQPPGLSMFAHGQNPLALFKLVRYDVVGVDRQLFALSRTDGQEAYLTLDECGLRETPKPELGSLFDFVDVSEAVQAGGNQWVDLKSGFFASEPLEEVKSESASDENNGACSTTLGGQVCGTSTLVKLDPGSDEYVAVQSYFQGSMTRLVQIECIEKVFNEHQETFFLFWAKRISSLSGTTNPPRIELLWHGTRKTPTSKVLGDENGFDMRCSTRGMWGQGIYFAERAEYSDRYAHQPGVVNSTQAAPSFQATAAPPQNTVGFNVGQSFSSVNGGGGGHGGSAFSFGGFGNSAGFGAGGGGGGGSFDGFQPHPGHVQNGLKEIILAQVLVGECCECPPDQSLRMPPLKPTTDAGGSHKRYDSVSGMTHGSRVYVMYDNGRARPMYKISYR